MTSSAPRPRARRGADSAASIEVFGLSGSGTPRMRTLISPKAPFTFPVVQALGIDPIWFGIIVILVVENGLITPPVGINVFVVKGLFREINLWTIYRGIVPFLIANIACLVIIMYVPAIATWLPRLMH